ncbi:hypothetical protein AB4K20DRAFT_1966716 [Rhizopus microsporus]
MYKAIVLNKIRSVKEKRAIVAASGEDKYIFPANTIKGYCESSASTSVCKDCEEVCHFSKNYFKCKLYKQASANDVGTSAATTDNEDTCKRCHEKGHKSTRSASCKYHISSKQEVFNKNLGQKYQPFTRKLPMDKCVADQCVNTLKPIIISACRDVRNIVFRAQIFVNYYITLRSQQELDNDIPHCIFRQQFWYSVCQLVNAKRVTASIDMPPNMMAAWNVFQSQYSSIVYHQQIAGGTSQCLAEACTELATSYHNSMVEHFESRLLFFFVLSSSKHLHG